MNETIDTAELVATNRQLVAERDALKQRVTELEWLAGSDTGLSSRAIWRFMVEGKTKGADVPWDSADFGRCHRLLLRFPKWRERLHEMAVIDSWRPLVEAWPELEKLYVNDRHRQLYARLEQIRCEERL